MTIYRVEYRGTHAAYMPNRDAALGYILESGLPFEDFEILDGSDEL